MNIRLKTLLRYLMSALYIGAGLNHFLHPQTYVRIIPPYMPCPAFLNGASGVAEITLGVLLYFNKTRKPAAWGIAIMLLLFFTVHVYMLQQALKYEGYIISAAQGWVRLAVQPLLILWALWYTKQDRTPAEQDYRRCSVRRNRS